ncbi:MAG: polyprenyl synthetase family protein [Bdellovibrionales bacterium]|nr:polyprenyl synthetase family protein [Bdellovibrionales bacterium]
MNIKYYSEKDFPSYLPKLNNLYDDLFEGGKGFRSLLTQKVARPLGVDEKTLRLLCQTIEFIHNASLLHDDLIDRSSLRRGKTTAWLKYTPEYAVLAGDYLLARVMTNLSSHGNIELVQFTSQTISELLEGEWIQDSLVGDFHLSFEKLTEVHGLKTASLFRWCLFAPFIATHKNSEEISALVLELGTILGILFQRSDDLLDYDVRNQEGKAILGDLKSGYLNSFGAFFCSGIDGEIREKLRKVESLEELYRCIGEPYFWQKVKEFDTMNQELIELYDHKLTSLQSRLAGTEKAMIADLQHLPEILYWRRKPKSKGDTH